MTTSQPIKITLPYPHPFLNPNCKKHWRIKSARAAQLRFACKMLAKQQPVPAVPVDNQLQLSITFCPPDKRRRDLDNVVAAFKSGFDGLADAWVINDSFFRPTVRWGDPMQHGAVVVEVRA